MEAYVTDGPSRHVANAIAAFAVGGVSWGFFKRVTYWLLFEAFGRIAGGGVPSRPVPAAFGVDGCIFRYEKHFVYWKTLSDGDIGIVTVLHERMHQMDRFREDFGT